MYVEPNINKMPYTKGVNFLMLWKSKKKEKRKWGHVRHFLTIIVKMSYYNFFILHKELSSSVSDGHNCNKRTGD